MKKLTIFKGVAVVLGSILVIVGSLALTVVPYFIAGEVSKRTFLGFDNNGSYNEMTQKWMEPPYEMSLQIWVFSVTNVPDVLTNGAYPKLIEKGPYTFVLHQRKSKMVFMRNDTQVLYRTGQTYFFNSTLSCSTCSLSDKVTIPNPIFQFIVDLALRGRAIKGVIELVLSRFPGETPFISTTVREMLFDGFEDPIISAVCSFVLVKPFCDLEKIPERIGFFTGQNETDDGEYLVDTGLLNAKYLGKVYKYNTHSELPNSTWYSPQARMINGTNQIFPPDLSSSERLYMFLGQMKRSIYLQYQRTSKVGGVPTWRFITPPELYDPTLPENKGFCNPDSPRFFDNETQPDGCLPKGFLDMSSTQLGHPRIYMSGSHFYNSPSTVYKIFDNFTEPSAKHDEAQYDIEPITGVIVRVKQRSQINIGMLSSNLKILSKMRNMIVPVLWFNETVCFDNGTRDELLNSLVLVRTTTNIVGIALLTLGLVLLAAFIVLLVVDECLKKDSDDEEQLIVNAEPNDASYENFPPVEPLPRIPPSSTSAQPSVDQLLSPSQPDV